MGRLILGFDAGCMACSELAGRIEEVAGDKLEVISLHDPRMQKWREDALGEEAAWAPTLVEVSGGKAKAWTGVRMGAHLSRTLGPAATWKIMQVLGDIGAAHRADESAAARAFGRMSRGQFLKGVGGVVVAVSAFSGVGSLTSPALAQNAEAHKVSGATEDRIMEILHNSPEYKQYASMMEKQGRTIEVDQSAVARIPKNEDAQPLTVTKAGERYDLREGWCVAFLGVPPAGSDSLEGSGSVLTAYVNDRLGLVGATVLQNYEELGNSGNFRVVASDLLGNRYRFTVHKNERILNKKVLNQGTSPDEGFLNKLEATGYRQGRTRPSSTYTTQVSRCVLCPLIGSSSCIPTCFFFGLANPFLGLGCAVLCSGTITFICDYCGPEDFR